MKSLKHRILCSVLSALCAASAAGSAAGSLTASAAALPAKFDLRNVDGINFVTPVRNQDPWGTCWAFGSSAAAEISIQYEIWKKYGITPEQNPIDLSELAVAWYSGAALPEGNPINPAQAGEGIYLLEDYDYGPNDILNNGGLSYFAMVQYAAGIGPFREKDAPYCNSEGKVVWYLYDEDGNLVLDQDGVEVYDIQPLDWDAPAGYKPAYYSVQYDWAVPESLRQPPLSPVLESANYLDAPVQHDENYNYVYNEAGTNQIKNELMQGRGVSIGFFADSFMPGMEDIIEPLYISDKYAHYTYDDGSGANHEVCIVGWDDNYPRSNFLQGKTEYGESKTPPADGAWIVKNSWGSMDSAFPNQADWGVDGTGYFYLSYYDKSIDMPVSYDFDVEPFLPDAKAKPMIVDQYDFMPPQEYIGYIYLNEEVKDDVRIANVFDVKQNQLLSYVSSITAFENMNVKYEVYKLKKDAKNPMDGTLLTSFTREYPLSGFHREALETPLPLSAGERYSIVQTPKYDSGYAIAVSRGMTKKFAEYVNESMAEISLEPYTMTYSVGVVNNGESWIFTEEGKWFDQTDFAKEYGEQEWYDTGDGNDMYIEDGASFDNYPIKGFSVAGDEITVKVKVTADQTAVKAGDTVKLNVDLRNPSKQYSLYDLTLTGSSGSFKETINYLAANANTSFDYEYTVTEKDLASGKFNITFDVVSAYAADKKFSGSLMLSKEKTPPLSVSDAVRLARFVAEDKAITGITVANSDFDKDGKLTARDVIYLLAKIAKLDKPIEY